MRIVILLIGFILVVAAQEQPTWSKSTNCTCGMRNLRRPRRIIAGIESLPNEFPFMAGIYDEERELVSCGGSILTSQHVLTAAHCLHDKDFKYLKVLAGIHDYNKLGEGGQVLEILSAVIHEEYNPNTPSRDSPDIGIIFLARPIKFNEDVGLACLPKRNLDLAGKTVTVLGWGRTEVEYVSNVLRKVDLTVIRCPVSYPNTICTSAEVKDSCQGDSGGPLLWYNSETDRYITVGIVSWGVLCATSPGHNVEVASFLDWIARHVPSYGMCFVNLPYWKYSISY